ncbi:MAG TPA: TlpA disulfide reductase family protein [Cyclobacteriaceae bacterium]|nr:TlpA disulfide reductase family protein [Cyclobacteriaceae bacterium]
MNIDLLRSDAYLVIPEDICSGCIKEFKNYILENNHNNLIVIISGNSSRKIELAFGSKIIERLNVIVDDEGLLFQLGLYKSNGQIFYYENKEISNVVEINPVNISEILLDLDKFLLSKQETQSIEQRLYKILKTPPQFLSHLVGQEAPEIKAKTLNNEFFDSNNSTGRILVINFWTVGCKGCVKEIPELNRVFEDSNDTEFEFISIASNTIDQLNVFMDKTLNNENRTIKYPVIPNGESIAASFGIKSYPVTLIINKDGYVSFCIPYVSVYSQSEIQATYLLIKKAIELTSV